MGKFIMGIDPGQGKLTHGGIAVLGLDGSVVDVVVMPDTMSDVCEFVKDVLYTSENDGHEVVAYLEDVGHGMPGQSSSATAKFARHCGHLEMCLYALGIRTVTCTPQKWQKMYQMPKGGEYKERKKLIKSKAQQMFPRLGRKVSLFTADALLIAEYGRKQEIGK